LKLAFPFSKVGRAQHRLARLGCVDVARRPRSARRSLFAPDGFAVELPAE
jgi:hypothetical protein